MRKFNASIAKKLILLKITLFLTVILGCYLIISRVIIIYKDLANLSEQQICTWINKDPQNNYIVDLKSLKVSWRNFKLKILITDLAIKAKIQDPILESMVANYVKCGTLTGSANIIVSILTGKIAIKDLVITDLKFKLNHLQPESTIPMLAGNLLFKMESFSYLDQKFTIASQVNLNQIHCNLATFWTVKQRSLILTKFIFTHDLVDVREILKYLPSKFINFEVINWLQHALVAGEIKYSYVTWDLKDHLKWKLKFQGLKLNYGVGWPPLENLNANLEIFQDQIKIYMESKGNGLILQQPINRLIAEVVKLDPQKPEWTLLINGDLTAPLRKFVDFTDQTIGLNGLMDHLKKLDLTENAGLALKFRIPLAVEHANTEEFSQVVGHFKMANRDHSWSCKVLWNTKYLIIENPWFHVKILRQLTTKQRSPNTLIPQVEIAECKILDQLFSGLKLNYTPLNNVLELQGDKIQGKIRYNFTQAPELFIDLEKINITSDQQALDFKILADLIRAIRKLKLHCEHVFFNKKDLGNLKLSLESEPQIIVYGPRAPLRSNIIFKNELMNLDLDLKIIHKNFHDNKFFLNGKLSSDNFGQLFDQFALSKGLLKDGSGLINFNLALNKLALPAIDLNTLEKVIGTLEVDLHTGTILKVDPGINKVFGLFSFDYLPKRLLLDFSDVLTKGFTFDLLKGAFQLKHTQVGLEDVVILGPAANVKATGDIQLATKNLDLILEFTNKLGATLPLAAAIAAGNPIVGAAVWLFDHAIGEKVSEFGSQKYKVIGVWDHPEIIEIN